MDIETISGMALGVVGLALMVAYRLIEHFDYRGLMRVLVESPGPAWAMWLLSISIFLFAQRVAMDAMSQSAQMALVQDEARDKVQR